MTNGALPPRTLARRVIDAGRSQSVGGEAASGAAAAACNDLYDELSRWIGADGCHALFTRALAEARKDSPPLQSIQLGLRLVPYVQGTDTAIAAHGDAETAAGIEILLIRLLELLGRLIGDDMAVKLIEPVLGQGENRRKKTVTGRGPE